MRSIFFHLRFVFAPRLGLVDFLLLFPVLLLGDRVRLLGLLDRLFLGDLVLERFLGDRVRVRRFGDDNDRFLGDFDGDLGDRE